MKWDDCDGVYASVQVNHGKSRATSHHPTLRYKRHPVDGAAVSFEISSQSFTKDDVGTLVFELIELYKSMPE